MKVFGQIMAGIMLLSVLSGCAGSPLTNDVWREHASMLDYTALADIAAKLVSRDSVENLEGLKDLSEQPIVNKSALLYDAVMLAIKAGTAIVNGTKSRNPLVNEAVNEYIKMRVGHAGTTL